MTSAATKTAVESRATRPRTTRSSSSTSSRPAESVARPFAYLIPPAFREAVATLQRHGLNVEELREDIELDLEVYKLDAVEKSPRRYQGHQAIELRVTPRQTARMVPAGTLVVKTAQPMGRLAVVLLEPRSEDGLAVWNAFDAGLKSGDDFPVLRLPKAASLYTTGAEPLPEDRGASAADHARRSRRSRPRPRSWRLRLRRPGTLDRWRALAPDPRRPAARLRRPDRPVAAVPRRRGADQGALPAGDARAG